MKAWEKSLEILQSGSPCYEENDNETIWEEEANGPELAQDALTKMHWHSQVPGSRAHESICLAAVQATENKGFTVENGMELVEEGFRVYEEGDMVRLHKLAYEVFNACYRAKKDKTNPYWNQHFYDCFQEYEEAVTFPEKVDVPIDEKYYDRTYAGWLSQIIGGAYGTCIEGYTGDAIKERYGEVDRYIRKPNTYNDDITYEIALLLAYNEFGKETTAKNIADEWVARIPMGWSAEEWALNNLKLGILPPESGRFHNPFNEWIGAQMRGAICGQLFPGDLKKAAECAWTDASISHDWNGILGEVFNALMVSMAYYETDIRKIVETCVDLIPTDSEYGTVVRFALEQCKTHTDYYSAWKPCEQKYIKYNWIHAYPNACAEIVALWFGEGDFNKTITFCGGCGQDVDCNAAQIMTVIGTIHGRECIPEYWSRPFGDDLDTYVRGLKKMKISELTKLTAETAKKLK
ncbi:MAG: ADP-ribosylglycohydrolase family protein [Erysipelotrichaceae bacterium]|nr:ADP-ribosylglycohydrolase family protein [Erysipelotrichaceae bacterium]MBQ1809831.1 ADP-ribosylglycohydrolase family protein [Erysipelotrichaceae bacterium]